MAERNPISEHLKKTIIESRNQGSNVTREEIAQKTGVSLRKIRSTISKLIQSGDIEPQRGKRKNPDAYAHKSEIVFLRQPDSAATREEIAKQTGAPEWRVNTIIKDLIQSGEIERQPQGRKKSIESYAHASQIAFMRHESPDISRKELAFALEVEEKKVKNELTWLVENGVILRGKPGRKPIT